MATGYLWDSASLGYVTGDQLPEHPRRARALTPAQFAGMSGVEQIHTQPDLGLPWVGRVHSAQFMREVRLASQNSRLWFDGGDTVVRPDAFEVALMAASGALTLTDAVLRGKVHNGFAAIRPPGHHASSEQARGFCIFNNVAICARYAQQVFGIERVLIVDWDVHPGDGTAAIFFEDPSVFVFSMHQRGILGPEVGGEQLEGRGPGRGCTRNVPVEAGTSAASYLHTFTHALRQVARSFKPGLVLVSAGFDAHRADPLGGLLLEESSFAELTGLVKDMAAIYASGRLVSLLEGGYQPGVLRDCVGAHLAALAGS
ncbi:MAG: histone deacetylase [Polyangiaceae bacterium]|nr:histone deacetylase [Polyangiaceae bacterium]